ncbi:MAG: hypothetical protein R3Y68_05255 [Rikenellaceae bacterium]
MATIKEFVLLEDEVVLAQVEGDAFNDSPNPIAKLIAAVLRIVYMIIGIKLRTYIIATNKRIVQIEKTTMFWGILPGDTAVFTLNKSAIQSVGYMTAVSFFIFKVHYFVISNMGGSLRITYKGSADELAQSCAVFDKLVCGIM